VKSIARSFDVIIGTELLISKDVYRQVAEKCAITKSIENAVIKGKSGTHVLYAVWTLNRSDELLY
jgi:hypothetical protein